MKHTAIAILSAFVVLCSCQKSWEERCAEESESITKTTCPRQLTPDLAMDSMAYDKAENRFSYYYRVMGDLDRAEIFEEQKEAMVARLQHEYSNSIELKKYKEHNMSFRCIYTSDSTGEEYLEFLYTPDDYQSGQSQQQ